MDCQEARAAIARELEAALTSLRIGNEGRARVCARRAAGIAIDYWLPRHPGHAWGLDAMSRLRHVQADEQFPHEVRQAALRLTARITERFTSAFSTSPLEDCRVLTDYFLEDRDGPA